LKTFNVLFLCTHNSARSVIGEALASTDPSKRFVGFSAGSTPGTSINPYAAEIAEMLGYPLSKLRSKSLDGAVGLGIYSASVRTASASRVDR